MKKYVFAALLLTQITALADTDKSLVLRIAVKAQDTFKIDGDRAIGLLTTSTISASLKGKDSQNEQIIDLGSSTQSEQNKTTLAEITGRSVRMIDEKLQFDQTIPADVSIRGFFSRKITSIRISAETIKAILAASLQKKGENLLISLGIKNEQVSVQYNVNLSDYTCENQNDNLTCNLGAEIVLDIQGK